MKKSAAFILCVLLFVMCASVYACEAGDFDFIRFAKEKVLKDFHPTANSSKAVAEYDEAPFERDAGVIRARVHMYYPGWVRKHDMLVEMDLKTEAREIRVTVLNDSNGMNFLGSSIFKDGQWVSLASLGWN